MRNNDYERAIKLLKKVALYSWRTNEQCYVRLDYSIQQEVDEFLRRLPDEKPAVRRRLLKGEKMDIFGWKAHRITQKYIESYGASFTNIDILNAAIASALRQAADQSEKCPNCHGSGIVPTGTGKSMTCIHCFGSGAK